MGDPLSEKVTIESRPEQIAADDCCCGECGSTESDPETPAKRRKMGPKVMLGVALCALPVVAAVLVRARCGCSLQECADG